jgi:ATP/maltotriose-dependent transcriptional regulator MalT
LPCSLRQKSPVLTPAELDQKRKEAEEKVGEEFRQAKAARAAREAAAAARVAEDMAAAPKTEMEQLREKERREIISRAQLALLVRSSTDGRSHAQGRGQAHGTTGSRAPSCVQGEKEEVKLMNQMIQFGKVMATRDQQVAQKEAAKRSAAEDERRVVEEMEQRGRAELEELEVSCHTGGQRDAGCEPSRLSQCHTQPARLVPCTGA